MSDRTPERGCVATENCVRCLKRRATSYLGHVLTEARRPITAGWCKRCLNNFAQGFRGQWLPEMNPTATARGTTRKKERVEP